MTRRRHRSQADGSQSDSDHVGRGSPVGAARLRVGRCTLYDGDVMNHATKTRARPRCNRNHFNYLLPPAQRKAKHDLYVEIFMTPNNHPAALTKGLPKHIYKIRCKT